jgi:hypothetical protein
LTPQQALDEAPAVHPGDWIEWQRVGIVQQGVVDFLHVETDGVTWAFVTISETWAVINLKFATVRTGATLLSTNVPPPPKGLA